LCIVKHNVPSDKTPSVKLIHYFQNQYWKSLWHSDVGIWELKDCLLHEVSCEIRS